MVQSLFIRTGVAEGHIFKGHGSVLGLLWELRLRQGLFLQNALDAVYSAPANITRLIIVVQMGVNRL